MSNEVVLEVCVDSVESALAAERGGAHRVELCSSLSDGGLTPSAGLIDATRKSLAIALHIMIRPRGADFYYSDVEFEIMRRDIVLAKQLAADGIVFGILDLDGRVDMERTAELLELAAPLSVTFHRAFDMSYDLFASLRDLQALGVDRVLTSGGKQSAVEGAEVLQRLVEASRGDIAIMAGGGIEDHIVSELLARTGVREIHASLRSVVSSPLRFQNDQISMGAEKGREYQRFVVDPQKVRRLLLATSHGDVKSQN
ncbi:MAG: copper homeostasis protein CutC [Candidatus Acidiferrum sp.]|jgi:copper homeostasis protein